MTDGPEPLLVDEAVEGALARALTQVPGLAGILLADRDGLPLVSSVLGEQGVPETSSLAAVVVDIGRRMARYLAVGDFEGVTFAYQNRYVYVSSLGNRRAQLLVVAKKNVNLGLMYLSLEDLKRALERFLEDFPLPQP